MKNLLLAAIFLVGITLCACNRDSITKVPVNADLKTAFNYKPGTYWIYRDSISGIIDSFFVRSNEDIYTNTTNGSSKSIEDIVMNISEYTNIPTLSKIDTQSWIFDFETTMFNIYFYDNKIYDNQVQFFPLINYPFQTSLSSYPLISNYYEVEKGTVINIFDAFTLNGQSFNNVAEISHSANINASQNSSLNSPYSYNDLFFISSDVGIIKMSLNHPEDSMNRVWEIQRWHIVK